ncbi:MAG: DUF192 domain-containing protein [Rhodocyclaceae bacterium]|nr:DUF192 domain-containing protein [Rhodocyclaceae bacterium]
MKSRLLAALIGFAATGPALAEFPRVELSAGMHRIDAEFADDMASRARGLMHRRQLAPQEGMLFAFPRDERHCMWMRNTLIPLSVAFLDDGGRIVNIERMAPRTEDSHCASAPARFALEMNQGWFAGRGLKAGDLIRGVAGLRAADAAYR